MTSAPGMAGWIWKKGNALTGYQKRYFELSGTELGYKKDAKDKVFAGKHTATETQYELGPTEQGKYHFMLHVAERSYYLYVESEKERSTWIRALHQLGCRRKAESSLTLEQKYSMSKHLGTGSYGLVRAAEHRKTGERVAIKKIKDAVDDTTDAKRLLREIKLLKHFRGHFNVVGLKDLLLEPNTVDFKHIYMVTDLSDYDLLNVIRTRNLTDEYVRFFSYQIFRALKYLHSAGVLHRDLKPNNLLVNENCDLKVCDFGLARVTETGLSTDQQDQNMTCYVVTRWYRPPELLLGNRDYTHAIDMWSVGCIIAELIGRKPLFPGKDYMEMLRMIVKSCGNPTVAEMVNCGDRARKFLNGLPANPRENWATKYPNANPLALDLMDKLLQFDPEKRLNANEALKHPYYALLEDDAPECARLFDFEFEKGKTVAQIRQLIYQEVVEFQEERWLEESLVEPLETGLDAMNLDPSKPGNGGP